MRARLSAFEVIGSIAILQLQEKSKKRLKAIAERILKQNRHIRTVAVKVARVKGRLRTRKLKIIEGVKTKEAIHKENNCLMKLNVETCYFSPRLSNERIEIGEQIKGSKRVLVMFAGVAPYALIIAKQNPKAEITAIELNREACRYAEQNTELNKLKNIKIIQGDVKKIIKKGDVDKKKLGSSYFDFIVMPRPQLKETFLKEAFAVARKGTKIFYYDFANEKDIAKIREKIDAEAKKAKKKIKILRIKRAGEIAPYKFRVRIDFLVL